MPDYLTIAAMRKYGGSFVVALSHAFDCADEINRAKIKSTWPEYWEKYADLAARDEAREERTAGNE